MTWKLNWPTLSRFKNSTYQKPKPKSKRQSAVSMAISHKEKNNDEKPPCHENYKIKIATTHIERRKVYNLAYQVYRTKGYIPENPNKEHILFEDGNRDTAIIYIEDKKDQIVGSLTILSNIESPLPSSHIFKEELELIKQKHRKSTEITRFVIPEDNRNSNEILSLLVNYAYLYSYHFMNADSIICQVNPRHSFFYEKMMGFTRFSEEKACPLVKGAPAILLCIKIQKMRELISKCHNPLENSKKTKRMIYKSFKRLDQEDEALLKIKRDNQKKKSQRKRVSMIFSDSGSLRAI